MKKTISSSTSAKPMNDRRGAALVLAMLVLAMVTIMGVYSATRSSLEQNISKNLETDMSLFFAAEAGLNHIVKVLDNNFANPAVNTGGSNWNFALDGTTYGVVPTYFHNQGVDTGASIIDGLWVDNGVQIVQRTFPVGNISVTYTVKLWDNNDADGPASDADGLIYIRSTAIGYAPDGTKISTAIQEMTLSAETGIGISDGIGQEFASSGKSSAGSDLSAVDLSGGVFQTI